MFNFLYLYFLQIGELYDDDPLGLELAAEFWCPLDPSSFTSFSPYNTSSKSPAMRQRASQKQASRSCPQTIVKQTVKYAFLCLILKYIHCMSSFNSKGSKAHLSNIGMEEFSLYKFLSILNSKFVKKNYLISIVKSLHFFIFQGDC